MADLEISTQLKVGDVTELDAIGAIDAQTFHDMEAAFDELFEAGIFRIILKLDRLNYISSAGVSVMIGAVNRCQENNGDIVFINPSGSVKEVFDLIGLHDLFCIVPTVAEGRSVFENK